MIPLDPASFLKVKAPLADVRSPLEFLSGHIRGAHNIPLFSDAERSAVGTLYKQAGMRAAFHLGLSFVGPKLSGMIQELEALTKGGGLKLYCFRGGMRSGSVADLVARLGIEVFTLKGGYKAYRRFCRNLLETPFRLIVVGGKTGSGKTDFLQALKQRGEQVLDLEEIASHRGSVFGHIRMGISPTQEQFENYLAENLFLFDREKPIWIEDESRMIGPLKIPDTLYDQMQKSPLFALERDIEERIDRLLAAYSPISTEQFEEAVLRIQKKLGGLKTRTIIELAMKDRWREAVLLLLDYYDRSYAKCLRAKNPVMLQVDGESSDFEDAISKAQAFYPESVAKFGFIQERAPQE
ncbi:tRNA 2-selenouridine(34) synthase MnmH [Estrella lausannensis]|uniref:tRNA 2-selenouridine synthase n=1 Tax=Estrella lausannensis TaxID=483423 RepID=A0A0H5E6Y6_9BACT|nr:tRNA 2-selenouridine(34) synthase MnmH [Estrella lausannensis]CRX39060.1 tRNA 2-selenouridine synthase [Estrella lausannensis]